MSIAELITEAKQGSAAAQKCLFDQFADKMMVICRRYVKSSEDSEELMLDGFYKFFKKLPSLHYQGDAALFGWLKKIMINECLMFLRKKTVFSIVSETLSDTMPIQEDALNNLSAQEIFNLVIQLPVGYRTIFNLHVIEGMSHGEIAKALGIVEGTSKSQLSKARILLQKMLLTNQTDYGRRKTQ